MSYRFIKLIVDKGYRYIIILHKIFKIIIFIFNINVSNNRVRRLRRLRHRRIGEFDGCIGVRRRRRPRHRRMGEFDGCRGGNKDTSGYHR